MQWLCYEITLQLLAPLHIGWRKVGNLQGTRDYVTGRNLWGALTERLTRDTGGDYITVGRAVDEQLAFTYFYPAVYSKQSQPSEHVPVWPWEEKTKFAWLFLGSYLSTALAVQGAEEASLHETEFITPRTRGNQPVYLVGYIFQREDCRLPWQKALQRLRIGGERGYGWGRLKLTRLQKLQSGNDKCFSYVWEDTGERPVILVTKGKQLLSHTLASNNAVSIVSQGRIEPLVGRVTDPKIASFGKTLSEAKICWEPGSILAEDGEFFIIEKGLWEKI